MCGIAGVVHARSAAPIDRDAVERMTRALVHRGPDDEGFYAAPGVVLGHRRLSIVDLSPASAQPMIGPGGTALTYNGEIYNWREVRRDLEQVGRRIRSTGDTEVVLAALDVWGEDALRRMEGMFAFAYWDPEDRSLFLARDRFGEKPLYYAPLGPNGAEGVVFASELRAMVLHPRVHAERSIDASAVAQYFLHEFVPAPRSIFANVRKLPRASFLRWREGEGVRVTRYYEPPRESRLLADPRELAPELQRRTEQATRARLVADVPVGVFLSGGLDSSFLAACATHVHPRVKTFNVSFEDASFDESVHARAVARHLGTEHAEHRLSNAALLETVPATLAWMDEPFADSSYLPTSLLAREARREVTVALGGEGGDELLAGYPTFVADAFGGTAPAVPRAMSLAGERLASLLPVDARNFSLSFKARQMAQGVGEEGARRHAAWLAPILPRDLAKLRGPRIDDRALASAWSAVDASARATDTPFDAATMFYLGLYLGEGVLAKVDRATMRASLEARAPLLDSQVAELCLSLPRKYRVRGSTTKWLMREAVKTLLPPSIVARPKKGFGAPVGAWMRGPLRELVMETLAPSKVREGGWLDPDAVARMLSAHLSGARELRKPLYAVFVFEHWRQRCSA